MKKMSIALSFLIIAGLSTYQNTYGVWWNPLTWFEKDTKTTEDNKTSDLYKTPTVCPQVAANAQATTGLKQAQASTDTKPDAKAQALKTSATDPFAAKTEQANQDTCPTGQQLCVGNLGDDNNATFCSSGDCPMGSAPVLNQPVKK